MYGLPAVALPLSSLRAHATVENEPHSGTITFDLRDFDCIHSMGDKVKNPAAAPFDALAELLRQHVPGVPGRGWRCTVSSDIPPGCGLGSGAAVTVAVLRAAFGFFSVPADPPLLSELTYEIEKLHHGTPSGIDNTIIAMEKPLVFRKGGGVEFLSAPDRPLFFVVGYTGIRHSTAEVVRDVATAHDASPVRYDALFREIGEVAERGAAAFEAGDAEELGALMSKNHELLRALDVSCGELDNLVKAAEDAGAAGAKLSGAGRGGCMAALASSAESAEKVGAALEKAGAAWVKPSNTRRMVSLEPAPEPGS